MIRNQLLKLAQERNNPCITISLNTHRTHPDNIQDEIILKNLCKEANDILISKFNKKEIVGLIDKLNKLPQKIDARFNLESLHILISEKTFEIIRSIWPIKQNKAYISDSFHIRPLIKEFNRSTEYMILLLSQSGVHLYQAINETITGEIISDKFPFEANDLYIVDSSKRSDAKQLDKLVMEYFNNIDKELVNINKKNGLTCIAICTEDNYNKLLKVADKKQIYLGYSNINYNNTSLDYLSKQSWEIIKNKQLKIRKDAVNEIKEAVSKAKVVTDLHEIYNSAKEGKADLLIINDDYFQYVKLNENSFDIIDNNHKNDSHHELSSLIAGEIISKNGRVVFVSDEENNSLGPISLKLRY